MESSLRERAAPAKCQGREEPFGAIEETYGSYITSKNKTDIRNPNPGKPLIIIVVIGT
jgi:hypothetical protein